MKKLGFLLLLLSASSPAVAEEMAVWSGAFYRRETIKLPQLDESSGGIQNWDGKNMTYRFSDKFGLALKKKGDLGGAGLEYSYSASTGVRFAIIRSPITGKKIPTIAIGIAF
ncbi:MAG: hypothetical protein G01um101491_149 [Parcubacteria group bacterium Gr01-1014_91]|nr:MAG: hypothetical protein G01um101491_149 [Parcubacteria group bacterium Gr01-1014_91]